MFLPHDNYKMDDGLKIFFCASEIKIVLVFSAAYLRGRGIWGIDLPLALGLLIFLMEIYS